tara:strand:- start:1675 stop:1938 length:264 start_codon:yes stop_codon:yes gene_type:complete
MKVSKSQLLSIIKEALLFEQNDREIAVIEQYISDELLPEKNDELTKVDVIEQGEGAGYESEDIESAIESLEGQGIIEVGDDDVIVRI